MSKELEYEFNNFANLLHKDCMNLIECLKKQSEDNKPILYLGKHYQKVILPYEEYQKMCNRLEEQEKKTYTDELKLVEKKLKALEIIKEKECDVRWLKFCIKGNAEVETYNSGHGYRKKLTEEEFDTLKEMLMKYRVSRCADSPKKRKLKGCSTWGYKIVDTKEEAKNLAKEWKQLGYYTEIKEVLE